MLTVDTSRPNQGTSQSTMRSHPSLEIGDHSKRRKCGLTTVVGIVLCLLLLTQIGNPALSQMDCHENPATTAALDFQKGLKASPRMPYNPAKIEKYFLDNGEQLGLDEDRPTACKFWTDPSVGPIYQELQAFQKELRDYTARLQEFNGTGIDLRKQLNPTKDICQSLELHPKGLKGIFSSGSLTQTAAGMVEPLFPPQRHPDFCLEEKKWLLSLDYLVHDFAAFCRRLKPTSRIVLVDMGADLTFHDHANKVPALEMSDLYRRFGFHWDHIYAYEITRQSPRKVFQAIPEHLLASYHWMNVGVESNETSRLNPWRMIKATFNEDDFVVVKLDIDAPSIEVPLANQLLHDPDLAKVVDVLYFEHHVQMMDMVHHWGLKMDGTILESLELFSGLRKLGIAAHFWV